MGIVTLKAFAPAPPVRERGCEENNNSWYGLRVRDNNLMRKSMLRLRWRPPPIAAAVQREWCGGSVLRRNPNKKISHKSKFYGTEKIF